MTTNLILKAAILFFLAIGKLNAQTIPNDPFYNYQFSLNYFSDSMEIDRLSYKNSKLKYKFEKEINHKIEDAWKISTGSKEIIVAIMEDGIAYYHEDVKDNIWQNNGEVGVDKNGYSKKTNGIDDDNNGYIDDVIGWDFYFNDPDPDCYTYDGKFDSIIKPAYHGIEVAGIIGARGNNGIGIAGINWDVSLMCLKMMAQGSVTYKNPDVRIEKAANAIRYAVDNGARIINWSGFVQSNNQEKLKPLIDAINYAEKKNVLIVVAAGNYNKNIDEEKNHVYPACFTNDNIITVAEIDLSGMLYTFTYDDGFTTGSNYGKNHVDIGAIGENYTTSIKHNESVYVIGGGTSCAAPVVSGVLALMFATNPNLSSKAAKEILLNTATRIPGLADKVKCEGMVNAGEALRFVVEQE